MPLDEFLPDYDANEVHSILIAAPAEEVVAAARALTPRDVPLVTVLMAVRRLPARLVRLARQARGPRAGANRSSAGAARDRSATGDRGRLAGRSAVDAPVGDREPVAERPPLDAPLLDGFTRAGFFVLADRPDELVLGVVGRFWTLDGGVERIAPDRFVTFAEPGFAKAVFNFHVREVAGGTVLTTETRIQGTDEAARRKFRRYWRVVMPGSALIRRVMLRAIRRRAERG